MIVLLAMSEKQVVISDQFNPTPITGRQSIFARVNAQTEARLAVEIVGIFSSLDTAAMMRERHFKTHPQCKYVQKVAGLDEGIDEKGEEVGCIGCGVAVSGSSRCPKCQKEFFEQCREVDPLAGKGDEVAVVRTSVGQFSHVGAPG